MSGGSRPRQEAVAGQDWPADVAEHAEAAVITEVVGSSLLCVSSSVFSLLSRRAGI